MTNQQSNKLTNLKINKLTIYQINKFKRKSDDEITIFKNGGGAHLDLMVAKYILTAWKKNKSLET